MRDSSKVPINLLQYMKIAILQRTAPGNYEVLGKVPEFYLQMFPANQDGSPCSKPWKYSFMLESFLPEAENFFESNSTTAIDTGFWIEDTRESPSIPLIALAIKIEDQQLLVIRSAQEDHVEKSRVLNKARKGLIERRHLSNELVFFKNKSLTDPLTKLHNRAALDEVLESNLCSAGKRQCNISLMVLDIDDFKKINDTYGHLTGDSVLAELGLMLKESVRGNDMAIRYGGEEFCILSRDITREQAIAFADKLIKSVSAHDFGLGRSVTVSIGLTMHKAGDSLQSLIGRADKALYQAKRSGKHQARFVA